VSVLIEFLSDPLFALEKGRGAIYSRLCVRAWESLILGMTSMPNQALEEEYFISRVRIVDHGEVYTRRREVNAMLDLVKQETERVDSRFLEPACGRGNFLAEVLSRKLRAVEHRYRRSQLEYERYAVLAVSSIYGIDILEDNVEQCRDRLFGIFDADYARLYKDRAKDQCRSAVRYILEQNIIQGDALTLETVGEEPRPIVFPEWSLVNGSMLKRRDFTFHDLLEYESTRSLPLFSDLGENVFIPTPIREYPLVHYLNVADVADELQPGCPQLSGEPQQR